MKILGEEGQSDQPTENKTNSQKASHNDSNHNNNNISGPTNNKWNNHRDSKWNNMPPRNNRWNNNRDNERNGEVQTNSQQQTERINQVVTRDHELAGPSDTEQHSINSLNTTNQSVSPYVQCNIEGEDVTLLIDTGATISVLTKEVTKETLSQIKIQKFHSSQ